MTNEYCPDGLRFPTLTGREKQEYKVSPSQTAAHR